MIPSVGQDVGDRDPLVSRQSLPLAVVRVDCRDGAVEGRLVHPVGDRQRLQRDPDEVLVAHVDDRRADQRHGLRAAQRHAERTTDHRPMVVDPAAPAWVEGRTHLACRVLRRADQLHTDRLGQSGQAAAQDLRLDASHRETPPAAVAASGSAAHAVPPASADQGELPVDARNQGGESRDRVSIGGFHPNQCATPALRW